MTVTSGISLPGEVVSMRTDIQTGVGSSESRQPKVQSSQGNPQEKQHREGPRGRIRVLGGRRGQQGTVGKSGRANQGAPEVLQQHCLP